MFSKMLKRKTNKNIYKGTKEVAEEDEKEKGKYFKRLKMIVEKKKKKKDGDAKRL